MTKHFAREIEKLKGKMIFLGKLVEERVEASLDSALSGDRIKAERVIEGDTEIDQLEVELEEECLKLLALYQPYANDLRFLVSALKLNIEFERVGDLAVNIAERTRKLSEMSGEVTLEQITPMAKKTRAMLRDALKSITEQDATAARNVLAADDEIDEINRDIYRQVMGQISESPDDSKRLMLNLSVSKNLERIADHASNIAEDAIYMIDGEIIRHQEPCEIV